MSLLRIALILTAASAAFANQALAADDYPTKPITIITAFGPGSASDTIARVIAQPLGIALKTNVIVEARVGARAFAS